MTGHPQTPHDDSPEYLDQILQALGRAQPPNHMQQRILRRLETRATSKSPIRHPLVWPWLTVATAAAAATVLVLTVHHTQGSVPPLQPSTIQPKAGSTEALTSTRVPDLRPSTTGPKVGIPEAQVTAAPSQPQSDTLLASFPAPEAPLTEQEKLLIRVARHGDQPETPTVSPDALVGEIAQMDIEPKDFFPPPPPPAPESAPETKENTNESSPVSPSPQPVPAPEPTHTAESAQASGPAH